MQPLPPKKLVAEQLLEESSVFVHVDPRSEEVIVPTGFEQGPQLVLQFGYNLALPIPDLEIDEFGIRGTLSFRQTPFFCDLPWSAIFALVDEEGRGLVWPESMPPELVMEMARESGLAPAAVLEPEEDETESSAPHLSLCQPEPSEKESGDAESSTGGSERALSEPAGKPRRPKLSSVPAAAVAQAVAEPEYVDDEPPAAEDSEGSTDDDDEKSRGKKPRPNHLRLIK